MQERNIKKTILIVAGALALGLILSQFTSLITYFKDKVVLHWGIFSLLSMLIQFPAYYTAKKMLDKKPIFRSLIIGVAVLSIAFGPWLIFSTAPFTYYTGGLIALMLAISIYGISTMIHTFQPLKGGNILLFAFWLISVLIFTSAAMSFNTRQYLLSALVILMVLYWEGQYFQFLIKRWYRLGFTFLMLLLMVLGEYLSFNHIEFFKDQSVFEDKIVYEADTEFHHLVITQWKDDYWFYIDRLKNLSTLDEFLFYEAMIHPAFTLADNKKDVLLLGGENGCALREILKYDQVGKVDVVSQDTVLRQISAKLPIFTSMNNDAYKNKKVNIIHDDLLQFISQTNRKYDVVVIDLPDPVSVVTNRFYTREFYQFCRQMLQTDGVLVTQAGSPYFATEAFHIIENTMHASGFFTIPLHNQVITIGEWGWLVGTKHPIADARTKMVHAQLERIQTRWLNREAITMITSFGKDATIRDSLEINTLREPLLYQYYLKGNWQLN